MLLKGIKIMERSFNWFLQRALKVHSVSSYLLAKSTVVPIIFFIFFISKLNSRSYLGEKIRVQILRRKKSPRFHIKNWIVAPQWLDLNLVKNEVFLKILIVITIAEWNHWIASRYSLSPRKQPIDWINKSKIHFVAVHFVILLKWLSRWFFQLFIFQLPFLYNIDRLKSFIYQKI